MAIWSAISSSAWPAACLLPALLSAQTPARRIVHEDAAAYQRVTRLTLTVQQRWCVDAIEPACAFKGPGSLRATPDGGVLVADAMGPLRYFDRTGRFVRQLGRSGRGPGEYGFVVDAHVASDGTITWFDNTQMRLASVRSDGRPGRVRRLLPPPTMADIFVVDTTLVILDVPASKVRGAPVQARYRTVPVSGAPRTLATVTMPAQFESGSNMRPALGPFSVRTMSAVSSRGDVVHGNGDRFTLEVFPVRGASWHLDIDHPSRATTSAERDSATADALRRYKVPRVAELPAPFRATYDALPGTHPSLQIVRALGDGTVWIRPTPPAGATIARWDVFSVDGMRIGYVMLPIAARVWDGARDWVLVTERDADDVPTFVRYRITAAR